MNTVTKNVRTGGKVVGTVDCPEYENITELLETESEERVLGMFNKANVIRIQGNERAKHQTKKAGKGARFDIGYNLLWDVYSEDEIKNIISNVENLKEAINSKKMQDAIDEYLASQQADVDAAADNVE